MERFFFFFRLKPHFVFFRSSRKNLMKRSLPSYTKYSFRYNVVIYLKIISLIFTNLFLTLYVFITCVRFLLLLLVLRFSFWKFYSEKNVSRFFFLSSFFHFIFHRYQQNFSRYCIFFNVRGAPPPRKFIRITLIITSRNCCGR